VAAIDTTRPRIWYTGEVLRPDGSATDVYGQACESGYGQQMVSGWIDPDWSLSTVHARREDVRPDQWAPGDGPVIEWLIERIAARLGWVDLAVGPRWAANMRGTFYAVDAAILDFESGVRVRLAAHIGGAVGDAVQAAVAYGLQHRQCRPAMISLES
jgi:hypothetical protein